MCSDFILIILRREHHKLLVLNNKLLFFLLYLLSIIDRVSLRLKIFTEALEVRLKIAVSVSHIQVTGGLLVSLVAPKKVRWILPNVFVIKNFEGSLDSLLYRLCADLRVRNFDCS